MKDVLATGEASSPQTRAYNTSKLEKNNKISSLFILFLATKINTNTNLKPWFLASPAQKTDEVREKQELFAFSSNPVVKFWVKMGKMQ